MKDFEHDNVLSLVGLALVRGRPFVMTPFMDEGDLKDYIDWTKHPDRVLRTLQNNSFYACVVDSL